MSVRRYISASYLSEHCIISGVGLVEQIWYELSAETVYPIHFINGEFLSSDNVGENAMAFFKAKVPVIEGLCRHITLFEQICECVGNGIFNFSCAKLIEIFRCPRLTLLY